MQAHASDQAAANGHAAANPSSDARPVYAQRTGAAACLCGRLATRPWWVAEDAFAVVDLGITPDQYDQMREKLGVGDTPPAGGLLHVAAVGEDGKIRVFEVWDSREQAEAWGEKVMAVRTEAGFGDGPPSIEYLDVHNVVQR